MGSNVGCGIASPPKPASVKLHRAPSANFSHKSDEAPIRYCELIAILSPTFHFTDRGFHRQGAAVATWSG